MVIQNSWCLSVWGEAQGKRECAIAYFVKVFPAELPWPVCRYIRPTGKWAFTGLLCPGCPWHAELFSCVVFTTCSVFHCAFPSSESCMVLLCRKQYHPSLVIKSVFSSWNLSFFKLFFSSFNLSFRGLVLCWLSKPRSLSVELVGGVPRAS